MADSNPANQTHPALQAHNQQGPNAAGAGSAEGSDNYDAKEQGKGLYGQYGLALPGHQGFQANAADQGNKDGDSGKAASAQASADAEPQARHNATGEGPLDKASGSVPDAG